MKSLFESASDPIFLDLPDADIIYYPQFFDKQAADIIFASLAQEIPWQQDEIRVYGKIHPQPRLTALFGNEGKSYSYSNITMQPHPWSLLLQKLKTAIEKVTDTNFTTVLLNQYRDGKDSNGWHSDNENELGINPVIASLSFGAERMFQLKHNLDKDLVVKIATTQEGVRCNSNEYTLWEEIQGLTNKLAWVKDWFAPVMAISENANILIMKKTEEKEGKKRPTEIPSFIFDAHYGNFGWLGNKFVCHDYGTIYGFLDYKKKFRKINW